MSASEPRFVTDLAARVLTGDTRAAARLCRLVDDRVAGYRDHLRALAGAPRAWTIGVTGSPGAGKSTLVDALVAELRKESARVGVVCVDPSSPFTGGAILGDRIRMQRHFADDGVFIRSVATRGALGGLSRSSRDVSRVLEAWGAAVVIVETVGVGQAEFDVTLAADTTAVVVAPGLGDDVQAIKAGLLECADVFVVNKADKPGADAAERDLENMLAVGAITRGSAPSAATPTPSIGGHGAAHHGAAHAAHAPHGADGPTDDGLWVPPIARTVATKDAGVPELLRHLRAHRAWLATDAGKAARAERARRSLAVAFRDAVAEAVEDELLPALSAAATDVAAGGTTVTEAVDVLLEQFRRGKP
jgi:LAO/AO transport system kinase